MKPSFVFLKRLKKIFQKSDADRILLRIFSSHYSTEARTAKNESVIEKLVFAN